MAFKMKGPSLLKMVKQMRENSPMKKDGEGTFLTKIIEKVKKNKDKRRKDKEGKTTTTAKQTTNDSVKDPNAQTVKDPNAQTVKDPNAQTVKEGKSTRKVTPKKTEERKLEFPVDINTKKIEPLPNPIEEPKLAGGLFNPYR